MRKSLSALLTVVFVSFSLTACVTATDAEVPPPAVVPEKKTDQKFDPNKAVPVVQLPSIMMCSPSEYVVRFLKSEHGEVPIMSFHTQVMGFPQPNPIPAIIFSNVKTGTVSVVVFVNLTNKETKEVENFACLRMVGDKPNFILPQKSKDKETEEKKESPPAHYVRPGGTTINYIN